MKAKRLPKKSRPRRAQPPPKPIPESRATEAVTTAWVLTLMTTAAADLAMLLGWGLTWLKIPLATSLQLLPDLAWFIALVAGALGLLLTLPVYRLRQSAPPRVLTAAGLAAAVWPIGVAIWRAWHVGRV